MQMRGISYDWIQKCRKERRMTQQELADRAGISRTYLSNLERGECVNPSWQIVNRISKALEKETFDQPELRYLASCYLCGTRTGLEMIPHRRDGRMVGWIFSCLSCAPSLYGTELIATLPVEQP